MGKFGWMNIPTGYVHICDAPSSGLWAASLLFMGYLFTKCIYRRIQGLTQSPVTSFETRHVDVSSQMCAVGQVLLLRRDSALQDRNAISAEPDR